MGEKSGINWTDYSFNAWWGCTKVSPACDNCYAEKEAKRFHRGEWGPQADRYWIKDGTWKHPETWNRAAQKEGKRKRVFAMSHADWGENRDDELPHLERLWKLIPETPWLDWLLLTKRPKFIPRLLPKAWLENPLPNVWLGTTAEDQKYLDQRWEYLREVPAAVHFLSLEPLLGRVILPEDFLALGKHAWCIVGGESGKEGRPMCPDWARSVRDQCVKDGVPLHFKQWGVWAPDSQEFAKSKERREVDHHLMVRVGRKAAGDLLDGRRWQEGPSVDSAPLTLPEEDDPPKVIDIDESVGDRSFLGEAEAEIKPIQPERVFQSDLVQISVPRPAEIKLNSGSAPPLPLAIRRLPSVWSLDASIEWLIEDLVPLSGVTLLTAASGTGKTWLAYAMASAVATGRSFLERDVVQRPVLYLDGENPLAVVKRNLNDLGVSETKQLNVWGGWNASRAPGPSDSQLKEFAANHRPFLIWDSLVEFHTGDEQSAKDSRAFMKHFRALADAGATVLVLHHTGKTSMSKEYRGSSDIEAAVDMAYLLEGEPRDRKLHRLILKNFKGRIDAGPDCGLEFHRGKGFIPFEIEPQAAQISAEQAITKIIAAEPGLNGQEIKQRARELGIKKHAGEAVLAKLPSRSGKGKEKLYFPSEAADPG